MNVLIAVVPRTECHGDDSCCDPEHWICGVGEGDCDRHYDCDKGLLCGSNNCRKIGIKPPEYYDWDDDCCYDPEPCRGGNDCCHNHICGEREGDCDDDDDCLPGLACGTDNCGTGIIFDRTDDCCFQPPPPPGEPAGNILSTAFNICNSHHTHS